VAKASLYQMLGVEPTATAEQIAAAYQQALAQLKPALQRGEAEAINQARMLKEGYFVLSDAGRRAKYDAALALESAPAVPTMLAHEGRWKSQQRTFAAMLALIVAVGGAIAYFRFADRVDATNYEYREAVERERAKKKKHEQETIQYKEIVVPAGAPVSAVPQK